MRTPAPLDGQCWSGSVRVKGKGGHANQPLPAVQVLDMAGIVEAVGPNGAV
jgi:metal-dependent amidase/aminoacylase/carboxypeptidase family protein